MAVSTTSKIRQKKRGEKKTMLISDWFHIALGCSNKTKKNAQKNRNSVKLCINLTLLTLSSQRLFHYSIKLQIEDKKSNRYNENYYWIVCVCGDVRRDVWDEQISNETPTSLNVSRRELHIDYLPFSMPRSIYHFSNFNLWNFSHTKQRVFFFLWIVFSPIRFIVFFRFIDFYRWRHLKTIHCICMATYIPNFVWNEKELIIDWNFLLRLNSNETDFVLSHSFSTDCALHYSAVEKWKFQLKKYFSRLFSSNNFVVHFNVYLFFACMKNVFEINLTSRPTLPKWTLFVFLAF